MINKPRILILLWHPKKEIAGGFVRVKEFLPYLSKNFEITAIDNSPSIFTDFKDVEIVEFEIPKVVKKIYNFNFSLGRLFEWLCAFYYLVTIGKNLIKNKNYELIYGPTGDNLHIFLSAVMLKKIFPKTKLLLDILNLEMPEGGTKNYFNNFKKNNFGLFDSLTRTYFLVVLLFIERKLIKNADFIITVSPYMKNVIAKYYPKEKIDFTPSGVNIPSSLKSQNKKSINGIYFGRQTKDKGIFDVLDVWEKVTNKIPDAYLVTAGSIEDKVKKTLEEQILKSGIGNKVEVKGLVTEEEKWDLLSKSKYFLHLAYFEPLVPVITILEALSSGLPVVMYDTKAVDDYPFLRKTKSIYIVPNKDVEEAAETILYLEKLSKEDYKKIGLEAKSIAKKFNWNDISKKEINAINNALNL